MIVSAEEAYMTRRSLGPVLVTLLLCWALPAWGQGSTEDKAKQLVDAKCNSCHPLAAKTGEVKEYPLKTPHSGPHGLVEDKNGNVWYTGNTGALVGKVDPKTGAVTEFTMPDPEAKDPHTLVFDRQGILWFTLQNSNR